jgi:hypothetical protein
MRVTGSAWHTKKSDVDITWLRHARGGWGNARGSVSKATLPEAFGSENEGSEGREGAEIETGPLGSNLAACCLMASTGSDWKTYAACVKCCHDLIRFASAQWTFSSTSND